MMMVRLVALECNLQSLISDTTVLRQKIDESGNSKDYDDYLNHLLVIDSYITELKRLTNYLSDNYVVLSLPITIGDDSEPDYIVEDLSETDIQDYIYEDAYLDM